MADYIVAKQPAPEVEAPEGTYVIKWFKDAEDSEGNTVSVLDKTETVTGVDVQSKIDSLDSQIESLEEMKAEKVDILVEIDKL